MPFSTLSVDSEATHLLTAVAVWPQAVHSAYDEVYASSGHAQTRLHIQHCERECFFRDSRVLAYYDVY